MRERFVVLLLRILSITQYVSRQIQSPPPEKKDFSIHGGYGRGGMRWGVFQTNVSRQGGKRGGYSDKSPLLSEPPITSVLSLVGRKSEFLSGRSMDTEQCSFMSVVEDVACRSFSLPFPSSLLMNMWVFFLCVVSTRGRRSMVQIDVGSNTFGGKRPPNNQHDDCCPQ